METHISAQQASAVVNSFKPGQGSSPDPNELAIERGDIVTIDRDHLECGTALRCAITVLRHASLNMVKTWRADGSIKAYDRAKHFTIEEASAENFDELSSLLTHLEEDPRACIIRGTYIGKDPLGRTTRVGAASSTWSTEGHEPS